LYEWRVIRPKLNLAELDAGPRPQAWNLNSRNVSRAFIDLKRLIATNARHLNFLSDHHNTAAGRYGQTTERYLGSRQNLKEALNDRLGLDR
jgi:hypothetical protein